ncbi:hypothetical protein CARUB_v10006921mg [Capsella rubella]|uniref:MYB transcription factor n=1 Tax=Capsella rubella TaxID=81985 RepID=R0H196_9BRAS|nr:hypothetical protein CARUB_v10006921mg [Capsella rubella]
MKSPSNEVGESNASLERMNREEKNKEKVISFRDFWTSSEDMKLRELVAEYGPRTWTKIAEKIQGRSAKTCRARWFRHLDPAISKKAFTDKEEAILLDGYAKHGNKWTLIAKHLPGRTDEAVVNNWTRLMKKKNRKPKQSASPLEVTTNVDTTEDSASELTDQAMQYSSALHYGLPIMYAVPLAMAAPHVSMAIFQPSSSSNAVDTMETEHIETKIPPKFIDFLGVEESVKVKEETA